MPEVLESAEVHTSRKIAQAIAKRLGVRARPVVVRWRECQDVPNFLKRFQEIRERSRHSQLKVD